MPVVPVQPLYGRVPVELLDEIVSLEVVAAEFVRPVLAVTELVTLLLRAVTQATVTRQVTQRLVTVI